MTDFVINTINLHLSKKTKFIAGNPHGVKVYKEQISFRIKLNEKNLIVFPNHIEFVSMSFVQGLISELTKSIGREETFRIIEFKSSNPKLEERLRRSMLY